MRTRATVLYIDPHGYGAGKPRQLRRVYEFEGKQEAIDAAHRAARDVQDAPTWAKIVTVRVEEVQ